MNCLTSTRPGISRGQGGGPRAEQGFYQAELGEGPARWPGGFTCHRWGWHWGSDLGCTEDLVMGLFAAQWVS